MIVDKTNFEAEVGKCLAHLKDSDFIAVDLEMSGIKLDDKGAQHDLPNELYYKSKAASSKYGIIQFGLCCFKNTENGLTAQPYNFYTFPRPFMNKFNRDIGLNNDCMVFHEGVGTDLNRWVYKGVNYFQNFSLEQVEKLAIGIEDDKDKDKEKMEMVSKDKGENLQDKDKTDFLEYKQKYEDFVKGTEKVRSEVTKTIEFTDSRSHVRKALYGIIEGDTPDFYFTTTDGQANWREKTIKVTRTTKEENAAIKKENEQKKRQEYETVIGFSKVWLALMNYKKPVIGHNCYLDLLFTFEHFHKNNPYTFAKFKENVNLCWPKIFDTKVLSSEFGREDISSKLSLEELYLKLLEITQIKISINEGFADYANPKPEDQEKDLFHSAGYDAFTTGSCYYMLSKLENSKTVFEEFINKVRMSTNKLFLIDFENPEKDKLITDKYFIILVMEKQKDVDRTEIQKIQNEMLNAIKEEARKTAVYNIQYSPNGLYQKKNYMSYFLGIDKKFQNEFLNFRGAVKTAIKKLNMDHIGIFNLNEYMDYFNDLVQTTDKFGQKPKTNQGNKK